METLDLTRSSSMILMGDINIDGLKLSKEKQAFDELLSIFNVIRRPLQATRVTPTSASSIDVVCSNFNGQELKVEIINTGISDHTGQISTIKIPKCVKTSITTTRRHLNIENLSKLKLDLAEESWNTVFNIACADAAYNEFESILTAALNKSCPLKKTRNNLKFGKVPVYDEEVVRFKKEFLEVQETYKRTNNVEDKLLSIELKKRYDLKLRDLRREHSSQYLRDSTNKSRAVWELINSERKSKHIQNTGIRSITLHGTKVEDPYIIAHHFNRYFSTIAEDTLKLNGQVRNDSFSLPEVNVSELLTILAPTSAEEISKIIDSLKAKSSHGVDEISSNTLKFCKEELTPPLTHITNLSFQKGVFPNKLKLAKVFPLHKKGNKEDMGNYRPISLISTFSKVIERIVLSRVVHHMTINNLLTPDQHGFTKSKSTSSAVVDFVEHVIENIEKGKTITGVFVDLSKAFDCLSHDVIIKKLSALGIRGPALNWIASFLSDRKQLVELKQTTKGVTSTARSPVLPMSRGVPQGSVLGPLLFLLFINDLPAYLKDYCHSIMYADDTVLLTADENVENLEVKAYISVNMAEEYCGNQDLVFNKEKTQQINFGKLKHYVSEIPNLHVSNQVRHLGVVIDEDLTWNLHIDGVCLKLSSALFAIRRTKFISTLEASKIAYYALFESHVRYGVAVWGSASQTSLERVLILQKEAVRLLSGVELWPFRQSCRRFFKDLKIMTVINIYLLEVICFTNNMKLVKNNDCHNYNTRNKDNYTIPIHKKALYERKPSYSGAKYFNLLPEDIKKENPKVFRKLLTNWLMDRPFYTITEFLNWKDFQY